MTNNFSDLLNLSTEKMKSLVDVNVVIGKMMTFNGISVFPISKVKCGFISGGINQKKETRDDDPFGGAAGGTVNLTPIAFLVITQTDVKVLHLEEKSHILENLIDLIPDMARQFLQLFQKGKKE